MNSALALAGACGFGMALGGLYFFALWETVRRVATLGVVWLQLSTLLRVTALLFGLYWIGGDDWRRWVAALAGVMLVRLLLLRRIGRPNGSFGATEQRR